jgi:diaminopimelate decarboxylase
MVGGGGSVLYAPMPLTRDPTGALELGGLRLAEVLALAGSPTYVYDLDAIARGARELGRAFDGAAHRVCYAVKANTAGAVVRALAGEGCGADVVSGGELLVALACGVAPDAVVYSGVAKRDDEIDRALACGPRGIGAIQIESVEEIARVEARARAAGRRARVGLRVNPSVDLSEATISHIATGHDEAKFGVPLEDAPAAIDAARRSAHLELVGLAAHAGSQFTSIEPYVASARVLFELARERRAAGACKDLAFVDAGGGYGVDYGGGAGAAALPAPGDFVRAARREQEAYGLGDLALLIEPGRSLVAAHGVLLARVIQAKAARVARWLMIDAGMNDLVRPALYQARHRVVALDRDATGEGAAPWRVVGPVCESSDDFGEHLLPREPPGAVALLDAGAYGYTMASEYNGRPLPVEVFSRGGRVVARTERRQVDAWAAERAAAGSP